MTGPETAATTPTGHPPGLYMMFFAELWERFCYYGMRALLVLYVPLLFQVPEKEASLVYGAYTGLVYATGTFGGYVADRVLGFRRSILLGGAIMAAGEFLLVVYDRQAFLLGLSLIIVGNGLFKPNISSLVGKLYGPNDPRRDSGFTIFYMGINIGALAAPLVTAWVSNAFPMQVPLAELPPGMDIAPEWQAAGVATVPNYRWGFAVAGVGMLLGQLTFLLFQRLLGEQGKAPPGREGIGWLLLVVLGCAVLTPIIYFLLGEKEIAGYILGALGLVVLGYIVVTALRFLGAGDRPAGQRMFGLVILLLANVVFWSCFEQAGSSLNLFAKNHVSTPDWFLFEWFQSVNAIYIVLLAPLFAWLWIKLARVGRNPSIPVKFGLALIQVGLGFGIALLAIDMAGPEYRTGFVFLFLVYLLHTTGELCLSPVGLSMVTKLAPAHMTGLIMGAWFLSIAFANYLAGFISSLTGSFDEAKIEAGEITGAESLQAYETIYTGVFWYAVGAGVLLLLFSKPVNRLMHGIK